MKRGGQHFELHAVSTVALSIYNLLALGGGKTVQDAFQLLSVGPHPGLDRVCMDNAVKGLLARRWLELEDGVLYLRAQDRRPVLVRYRGDWRIDDNTGEVTGGWTGWLVGGNTPIEEATK